MKDFDYIQKRSEATKKKDIKRMLEKYHYARGKGLSSVEARVLMSWSKKRIDNYFKEKEEKERMT